MPGAKKHAIKCYEVSAIDNFMMTKLKRGYLGLLLEFQQRKGSLSNICLNLNGLQMQAEQFLSDMAYCLLHGLLTLA